jgi:hypothetical protein
MKTHFFFQFNWSIRYCWIKAKLRISCEHLGSLNVESCLFPGFLLTVDW